jgi:hypothetical protein
MYLNATFMAIFSLLIATASATEASAQTVDELSVVIEGTQLPIQNGCQSPCAIDISNANGTEKTYGCVKISGSTAGQPAQIMAINPAAGDETLKLSNAVIKGGSASCYGEISASAIFTSPPSTANGSVRLKRFAKGSLMRGLGGATTDWIEVNGEVDTDPIYGWERWTVGCSICGNFEMTKSENWPQPQLPDPRVLSLEINFYLWKTIDKLTIAAPNQIDIHTEPGGGGGDDHNRNVTHGSGKRDKKPRER